MLFKKGVYFVIVALLLSVAGKAQIVISSFAVTTGNVSMTGGNPFVLDATSKCMAVNSGLSALESVVNDAKGIFTNACQEAAPASVSAKFSLSVYPNPTRGMSVLKCTGEVDPTLSCLVKLMTIDGKVLSSQMVPVSNLQSGFMVNVSTYASGTYVVVAELMGQRYSLRLIRL